MNKKNSENYPAWTPCGKSQRRKNLCYGITFLGVGSRGFFRVNTDIYFDACKEQGVPVRSFERHDDSMQMWFDQKRQWGLVALAFPDLLQRWGNYFPGRTREEMEKNILDYSPSYWEFWKNGIILKGMSKARDFEIYLREHEDEPVILKTEPLHPLARLTLVGYAFTGGNRKNPAGTFLLPVEKIALNAMSGKKSGFRCNVPYVATREDIPVSSGEIAAKRAALDELLSVTRDFFFPETSRIKGDRVEIVCIVHATKEKAVVAQNLDQWITRDLSSPCHFRKENGEWRLVAEVEPSCPSIQPKV